MQYLHPRPPPVRAASLMALFQLLNPFEASPRMVYVRRTTKRLVSGRGMQRRPGCVLGPAARAGSHSGIGISSESEHPCSPVHAYLQRLPPTLPLGGAGQERSWALDV